MYHARPTARHARFWQRFPACTTLLVEPKILFRGQNALESFHAGRPRMGKKKKSKAKPAAKQKPAVRAPKQKAAKGRKKSESAGGRRSGLRGAAPWAARHAAKHAAEARARNASPAPPGSARATLRTPEAAEQIKATVSELHNTLVRIRALRKNFNDKFYELGVLLGRIKDGELYIAKGYSSFETFLEREIESQQEHASPRGAHPAGVSRDRRPRIWVRTLARRPRVAGRNDHHQSRTRRDPTPDAAALAAQASVGKALIRSRNGSTVPHSDVGCALSHALRR